MKKTSIILLALFYTICTLSAKTRVIKNPAYEVKNTGIYNIEKIVLTDTSTRLYIHITFIPHWWVQFNGVEVITDCKTGKNYTITGTEGSEFGKKIWMPDSGDSTIVLIFPKLDNSVEKIDCGKYIFGVSLKGKGEKRDKTVVPAEVTKWMETELAKTAGKAPVDFNSPGFFNADTAHLIGYIKGYDTRLGFTTGVIYTSNQLSGEDYPTVIQIFPDGRFEAKLPLAYPVYSIFIMNDKRLQYYLEPGQTLAMVVDWEEFLTADRLRNIRYKFKDIGYKGTLAKINDELNAFPAEQPNYQELQKKITTMSPTDFKKEQMDALGKSLNKMENYFSANKLTPKASVIIKNQILLTNAVLLFDFIDQRGYMARQDTVNPILKQPVTADYFDFFKELPMNDNSLLVPNEFQIFVNRFEFCSPFRVNVVISNPINPKKDYVTYLLDENLVKTEEDKELFRLFNKPDKSEEEKSLLQQKNDQIKPLFEKYKDNYKNYEKEYIEPLSTKTPQDQIMIAEWKKKDSVLVNTLGLEPNLVYDITKIRSLRYGLKRLSREQAMEYWNNLKTDIKYPILVKTGSRILNETFPEAEVSSYELPAGKATDVFRKITDQFKGKILFVDFWATTCGPCISNIKHMKPIREKYKDNPDFDFIFITDERSSPEEAYKKMVAEQELKNTFRISADDFYYLRQLFKFNGIPRYAVIDKDGKVLSDNFAMYNFENELNKILGKDSEKID